MRSRNLIASGLAGAAALTLAGAPALAQDWRAQPRYGTADLTAGFRPDPHRVAIEAGGDGDADHLGAACTGYIDMSKPDYDLNYETGRYELAIYAEASSDITLVIYGPDRRWYCSDDHTGTNPAVVFEDPMDGNYNIWVGTYGDAEIVPAVLFITEGDPFAGARNASGSAAVEWGDNTSRWANDGECDDPRFAGPGMARTLLDEDRFHDARDCQNLYRSGQVYLR